MQVEDIADVAPGRVLVRVKLEKADLGSGLIRPDSTRSYLPLAQIIQVGDGAPSFLGVGQWWYISQYAGQIISLEGVGGPDEESRLICSAQDLLCWFHPKANDLVERLFAA